MNLPDNAALLLKLLGIAAPFVLFWAALRSIRKGSVPPVVARRLLTSAELRFLHVLTDALPFYFIATQVSMGALLRPAKGLEGRDWWAVYGRFSQKIVDYVLVDRGTGDVVALVELDDRSHNTAKDAARDAMLQHAGYVVVRFSNQPWPTAQRVRERFADLDIHVLPHSTSRTRSAS